MAETGIIKYTSALEAIRARPGMYLGWPNIKGLCHLLVAFLDDLLADSANNTNSGRGENNDIPRVEFEFHPGRKKLSISVMGVRTKPVLDAMGVLDSRPKTPLLFYPGSEARFHLDLSILVAATETFCARIYQTDSPMLKFQSQRGKYTIETIHPEKNTSAGDDIAKGVMKFEFTLDSEIWHTTILPFDQITEALREYALLNPRVTIVCTDRQTEVVQRRFFHYKRGIFDEFDNIILLKKSENTACLHIEAEDSGRVYRIGICIDPMQCDGRVRSWCGSSETKEGGSLINGILDGIIAAFRKNAKDWPHGIKVSRKSIVEHVFILAAVGGQMGDVRYAGATKDKLDMPALQKYVKRLVRQRVDEWLASDAGLKERIMWRFQRWSS
ncbi:DNA gyrase/topoisomerase IV subunit B [Ereboglobus sp. PH5-10]|uniref:hypothetical protein n=1 Tax=Ereboglobus sp. PH5-10 TaxID=2940629 RepID=UPI002406484A|nr:hypothetical protein [Ereboglobus sp. PH5-10]MDF9826845.1 DNA gyrase/topoisomerase IV subunit B [Ereboglobus sp. PH5-10]